MDIRDILIKVTQNHCDIPFRNKVGVSDRTWKRWINKEFRPSGIYLRRILLQLTDTHMIKMCGIFDMARTYVSDMNSPVLRKKRQVGKQKTV